MKNDELVLKLVKKLGSRYVERKKILKRAEAEGLSNRTTDKALYSATYDKKWLTWKGSHLIEGNEVFSLTKEGEQQLAQLD